MVDRVSKELRKLSGKEAKAIKQLLQKIKSNNTAGLDLKALRGRTDIYRVRKGSMRIIFRRKNSGKISILAVERRSEKTYRHY